MKAAVWCSHASCVEWLPHHGPDFPTRLLRLPGASPPAAPTSGSAELPHLRPRGEKSFHLVPLQANSSDRSSGSSGGCGCSGSCGRSGGCGGLSRFVAQEAAAVVVIMVHVEVAVVAVAGGGTGEN